MFTMPGWWVSNSLDKGAKPSIVSKLCSGNLALVIGK
jgi:hypothetical protein